MTATTTPLYNIERGKCSKCQRDGWVIMPQNNAFPPICEDCFISKNSAVSKLSTQDT